MKALSPRSRKVRVLATLGPASSSPEMIATLFQAGADAQLGPLKIGKDRGRPVRGRA